MAIDEHQFEMIRSAKVKGRALSAGYPDLLVQIDGLSPRNDTKERQEHHSWKHPIADSVEVFAKMGLVLEVIDRAIYQGCERVADLNIAQDLGEYDLVIDPGTSEHCFNIPQALVNLAGAVKVGGYISQAIPMAMFNHGYWNVNPVAFVDFYELNGFEIHDQVIRSDGEIFRPKDKAHLRRRMVAVPEGAVNLLLARRLEKKPFGWPQQELPA